MDGIAASYIKTPKDRLGLSRVNNPWVALIIDSMKYYKPRWAFCELQVLNSAYLGFRYPLRRLQGLTSAGYY